MIIRRFASLVAAASLAAAPAAASPEPAAERIEGSEMRAVLVLPALAILIPLLLVLLLTGGSDAEPLSP